MIFRTAQYLALILLLSACQNSKDLEETIIIYDPIKNELFINMLKDKKVNFRIQDNGQIFYPIDQKDVVIEAFEKATGKKVQTLPLPQ